MATAVVLIIVGLFFSAILLDFMIFVVRQFYVAHFLQQPTWLLGLPQEAELSRASLILCGLFLVALIIVISVVVAGVQFLLKIFPISLS